MQANMNMSTSAKALNLQADLKAAELTKIAHDDFHNNDRHWSDKPTSRFTTVFGEGLLKKVYHRSSLYTCRRVAEFVFQVSFIGENEIDDDIVDVELFEDTPIPLFRRDREVKISKSLTLDCDCACQDIVGPRLAIEVPDLLCYPCADRLPTLPASQRLKNYSSDDVKAMGSFFDNFVSQSYEPSNTEDNNYDDEIFASMSQALSDNVTLNSSQNFDNSFQDASLPPSIAAKSKTRDVLKQKIEACCASADTIGLEARVELGRVLDGYAMWCSGKLGDKKSEKMKDDDQAGTVMCMTKSNYTGTEKRIFNTYHMPR
ncbi:hypothetical protein ACHAXR_004320 [Thalassiosira sp. AJA248-18]